MARSNYRRLLDHPKFIEFYAAATPIDVLENSKIGSRPARRTGQRSLNDLRSIPWVFSWNQSRFNLTGWFGSGMALNEFKEQYPDDFNKLKTLSKDWPFLKYSLIQIESNLLNADPDVMLRFAQLLEDSATRKEFMDLILNDFEICLQRIEDLMGASVEARRISKLEDSKLREAALKRLHDIQLDRLQKWRAVKDSDEEQSQQYLLQLLLNVNALSGGLKSTG
jgi:phosphoenolpyruvate carboxylase